MTQVSPLHSSYLAVIHPDTIANLQIANGFIVILSPMAIVKIHAYAVTTRRGAVFLHLIAKHSATDCTHASGCAATVAIAHLIAQYAAQYGT